jgi:hypothetical protein
MTIQDLITNIDRRLMELGKEIASLEAARGALIGRSDGHTSTEAKPASAPKRAARKPGRPRPARGEIVPAEKLVGLLGEHGNLSTAELAKLARGGAAQVLPLLKELETGGHVKRLGERRSTRWHAVTEEDRIAARVAEPERAGKGT